MCVCVLACVILCGDCGCTEERKKNTQLCLQISQARGEKVMTPKRVLGLPFLSETAASFWPSEMLSQGTMLGGVGLTGSFVVVRHQGISVAP